MTTPPVVHPAVRPPGSDFRRITEQMRVAADRLSVAAVQLQNLSGPRPIDPDNEPPHGSIILAHGATGTAYQRFHNDGLYHGTNGRVATFRELLSTDRDGSRLKVVYTAPQED